MITEKYYFLVLFALLCFNFSIGQNPLLRGDCHIVGSQEMAYENVVSVDGDFHIKVYFNIISRSDGSGMFPDSGIAKLKVALNESYNPHGIYFNYNCDVQKIKDDRLYETSISTVYYTDYWTQLDTIIKKDGINIFLKLDDRGYGTGTDALAGGIGKNYFVIEADLVGDNGNPWESMIQHQMGHCLGLYHTAYGSGRNENVLYTVENGDTTLELFEYYWEDEYLGNKTYYAPTPEAERVDGSNGETAGDYVADTDASFICLEMFYTGNNCEIEGYEIERFPEGLPTWDITNPYFCGGKHKGPYTYITDPVGDYYYVYNNSVRYNVLHNFMSQVPNQSCRDHFTQGQVDRMRYLLENHDTLGKIQMTDEEVLAYCECREQGTINIYKDTTFSQEMLVTKDIVVHGGAILTVNTTLEFAPGTAIYVEREGTLLLDGGTLTSNCTEELWKGIYVQGNVEFPQPSRDTILDGSGELAGRVVTQNAATISFARNGTYTHDDRLSWPEYEEYWGGVIYSTHTEFIDNRRSVAFMRYGSYGLQQFTNKSRFYSCDFIGDSERTTAEVGISLWKTYGVKVEKCRFKNYYGDAIGGISYGAKIVNNNVFENNRRAILMENTSPFEGEIFIGRGESSFAENNNFVNNSSDISLSATHKIDEAIIEGNDFLRDDSYLSLVSTGVIIEGPSIYAIKQNDFYNVLRPFQITNTGDQKSRFECNTITYHRDNTSSFKTPLGIYARGVNSSFQFLNNYFDIKNLCVPDVRLQAITPGDKVVNKQIGNMRDPAGNCFTSFNYGQRKLEIETIGETAIFNYYVPPNETDSCYYPHGNLSDGGVNRYKIKTSKNGRDEYACTRDKTATAGDKSGSTRKGISDYFEFKEDIAEYWEAGNYDKVKKLFKDMGGTEGLRLLYGVHLTLGELDSAEIVLNSLSLNSLDDLYFKQTQELYLNRLNGKIWPADWTGHEQDLLRTVAESEEMSASYAKALLAFDGDTTSVDFIEVPCSQAQPRSTRAEADYEINLYPNPTRDRLTIQYSEEFIPLRWKMYTMSGKEMTKGVITENEGNIGVSNLDEGVYILILKDKEGQVFFKKFIKQ